MTFDFLPNPVKSAVFQDLLDIYPIVSVQAFGPGIVGPKHLLELAWRNKEVFVTDWSYHFARPISDMEVTDEALSGTLSYGGQPCFTRIPWDCVAVIVVYPPEPGPAIVRLHAAVKLWGPDAWVEALVPAELPTKPSSPFRVIPGGKKDE